MLKNIYLNAYRGCSYTLRQQQLSSPRVRHYAAPIVDTSNPYALEQIHIDEAIKLKPTLAAYNTELWQRAHATFSNHGLQTINFLRIVTGNPTILKRTPQGIIETLEIWRSCQFGEKLLHLLITKYPELLDITDTQRFRTHIAYLKSRVSTNKNVWKVLMNSPELLEQSEQQIEEKFEYYTEIMRIEIPEIVKSAALTQSLSEVRCRHEFLLRLGLFTPRSPKADPLEPTTNHRLYQITDTSEKAFATKICRVTLAEYEAFKELYAREQRRKRKSNAVEEDDYSDED